MDGFVLQQKKGGAASATGVSQHDVMGYHTDAEIPNYWAYARAFVLQDAMFMGDQGWSGDEHLEMTSEWSANCKDPKVLSTCVSSHAPALATPGKPTPFPWVNLFQLMDINGVSWKYYLGSGPDPDCDDGQMTCDPQNQQSGAVPSYWNPVPGYTWVNQQGSDYITAHVPVADQLLADLKNGTLPQVSWVVPSFNVSEHPPNSVTAGMEYVTSMVNAVMQSPYWQNTAIFIAWDDWGGFYDHAAPPILDYTKAKSQVQGLGLRVPGLLISPYAKAGLIDHQVLSFDSYAVLIEQLFMNGAHLDPVAMGQPDNRPTVRDALTTGLYTDGTSVALGQLINEFDFTQAPLPTLILSTHIPTGIAASCGSKDKITSDCTVSSVKLSWAAVAGGQVPGPFSYTLLRDGAPIATTAATTYTDKAGSGVHTYTVFSTDPSGTASPPSAAAEADVP